MPDTTTECDSCNRYPDSPSNGVKLCSECSALEFILEGDLGLVQQVLLVIGWAHE